MVTWEGYEKVEFKLSLSTKGILAIWEELGRWLFTRTCLAVLEDVFCEASFVWQIKSGWILRSNFVVWRVLTLIGFIFISRTRSNWSFARCSWALLVSEGDFISLTSIMLFWHVNYSRCLSWNCLENMESHSSFFPVTWKRAGRVLSILLIEGVKYLAWEANDKRGKDL